MIQLLLLPLFLIGLLWIGCSSEPQSPNQREFLEYRLGTISLLANRFTKMHLDDAVRSGYEKTLELLDSIESQPSGADAAHFFRLARIYYVGATPSKDSKLVNRTPSRNNCQCSTLIQQTPDKYRVSGKGQTHSFIGRCTFQPFSQ